MINDDIVSECSNRLERELRNADEAINAALTVAAIRRAKHRRNAIYQACNALWRFKGILK